jgi:hypothetical protein
VLRWPDHPLVASAPHEFADCGHALKGRAARLEPARRPAPADSVAHRRSPVAIHSRKRAFQTTSTRRMHRKGWGLSVC